MDDSAEAIAKMAMRYFLTGKEEPQIPLSREAMEMYDYLDMMEPVSQEQVDAIDNWLLNKGLKPGWFGELVWLRENAYENGRCVILHLRLKELRVIIWGKQGQIRHPFDEIRAANPGLFHPPTRGDPAAAAWCAMLGFN